MIPKIIIRKMGKVIANSTAACDLCRRVKKLLLGGEAGDMLIRHFL